MPKVCNGSGREFARVVEVKENSLADVREVHRISHNKWLYKTKHSRYVMDELQEH
jgi:hypothetical protein